MEVFQHLATGFGPCQSCGNAWRQLLAHQLQGEALWSQHLGHVFYTDRHGRGLTFGKPEGHTARQAADGALELPHAGLTRVARNDVAQRRLGEHELLCRQACGL